MVSQGVPANATSDQLRVLYEVTRRLATFVNLDDVVRFATRRARELFDAEGCALILLDRERNEFFFPVSSQRESGSSGEDRLAEVRFPADHGIAGWVLTNDEAALVENTASDPRFYGGVDRETAIRTKALLCAPLRSGSESIGVIEVINPAAGFLNRESLRFLETLGNEVAVAYEKAALHARLRGEVINLRKLCLAAGLALLSMGVGVGVAATLAHRARVLPWWELLTRRGFLAALVFAVAGAALIAAARGWLRRA